MKSNVVELIDFVLEKSEEEPLRRREKLVRALSQVCGDEEEEKQLKELADNLDRTDRLCQEFKFNFIQKNKV